MEGDGGLAKRLQQQIDFVLECDRLKSVTRQTLLVDGSRQENSAEHSWHLALMLLLMSEYADERVDRLRALEMVIVHDLVEIDAGDTFCYDKDANEGREDRERRAAERLFGILPPDQARRLRELWEEFEARETPEARLAAALDRMQPLLANLATEGHSWQRHGVVHRQVVARTSSIADSSRDLWEYMRARLEEAVAGGILER